MTWFVFAGYALVVAVLFAVIFTQWKGLQYPIECVVCGAGGTLEQTGDGRWKFVIAENGLERDRTTEEGRGVHCDEIAETQGGFFMDPAKRQLVAERLPKYQSIQFPGI